jgi:hypothetical protein
MIKCLIVIAMLGVAAWIVYELIVDYRGKREWQDLMRPLDTPSKRKPPKYSP